MGCACGLTRRKVLKTNFSKLSSDAEDARKQKKETQELWNRETVCKGETEESRTLSTKSQMGESWRSWSGSRNRKKTRDEPETPMDTRLLWWGGTKKKENARTEK